MDPDIQRRRIAERLAATRKAKTVVSERIGKGRDYLPDFLNGKKNSIGAEILAALAFELECTIEYLVDPEAIDPRPSTPREALVRVRGYVGASPDARVQFAEGDVLNDYVTLAPGTSSRAIALYVDGPSMRDIADHGSLIFYDDARTPPTPDMIGQVVVVETEGGDVLVKRLQRGQERGTYDLASNSAATLPNQRLKWAAHILAIVPPHSAANMRRQFAA